jgi:adenylate cyclase
VGVEIERKFLVKTGAWQPRGAGIHMQQGYLASGNGLTVRVRIEDRTGKLTIKGPTTGLSRSEFEYTIPEDDARHLLQNFCEHPLIDKHRYVEAHGHHTWEIDVFHGDNEGLIVAEVELVSEDDVVDLPEWVGQEVSSDFRYCNSSLRRSPFKTWAP